MNLVKPLLLLICAGCTSPTPEPKRAPIAQTQEFDIYVEGAQALIIYTGSAPARSSHDFMGGGLKALYNATGCGFIDGSVETSTKAILGQLNCTNNTIEPRAARGQSGRVSPRRGLGETLTEEEDREESLNSEGNDTNV